MKKVKLFFEVLLLLIVFGVEVAIYLICENSFLAWFVLGISIITLVILRIKKVKAIVFWGGFVASIFLNLGVFPLTNRVSLMGGIASKIIAPIIAEEIGQSFNLSREETEKQNKLDADAEWDIPERYNYRKVDRGNYTIEVLEPEEKDTKNVILQIHGGAFCRGISNSNRDTAGYFAEIGDGAVVVTPDYTTSEKAPYPAALNDCIDTYQWILDQGYSSDNIILTGDSAGGNLVLAVTLYLRDHEMDLPAGIIAMSPVADLHFNSKSCYEKADVCVLGSFLGNGVFNPNTFFYTAVEGIDLNDPYLSPVFGDYTGFPPILIQVGTREILLDDARAVAQKAKMAGVDVTETEYYQMFHVFQISMKGKVKEADDAWREIEEFVKKIRQRNY